MRNNRYNAIYIISSYIDIIIIKKYRRRGTDHKICQHQEHLPVTRQPHKLQLAHEDEEEYIIYYRIDSCRS